MKKYFYTPVLVMLFTAFMTVRAQDREEYLGLPGDNLNLYAVMKLFQESETIEGFERQLNEENSRINNLDLDGDGYVDYIRVIDNVERNVHFIVLQVAINSRENQDVAVFTVMRETGGQVNIQLVGDEALYGRNYIIEPIYDETPNPGYAGNNRGRQTTVYQTTTYEVASWPLVRFIFLPSYVVWRSPWYYHYYPSYWRPWSPFYWHYYNGYHSHYHDYYFRHYRPWNQYRHPNYHSYYYSQHRAYSPRVSAGINDGRYKNTYSRPEQRREGMAMYERTHPDQRTRPAGRQSENPAARRSAAERAPAAQPSGTSTSQGRRPAGTGTTPTTTGTSTEKRSTPTGTPRNSTSTSTEKRSTPTGSPRNSTRTSTEQQSTPTGTPRQSTGTNTERRPANTGGTRQSTSRSDGQSKASGVSNSGRRSSGSNSSGSSAKPSQKPRESSTERSSGRR